MQTKIEQEQLAYQNLEQMINEMLGSPQSDLNSGGEWVYPELRDILGEELDVFLAQRLLFEGCRELDYHKVFDAINAGANVNITAPLQSTNVKNNSQHSNDIIVFGGKNIRFSPLSLMAMHGNRKICNAISSDKKAFEIAKLLLAQGACLDIFDVGDMGNTPLHWAIITFKHDLCELLIEHAVTNKKNIINAANKPTNIGYGSNPPLIMALKVCSQGLMYNTWILRIARLLIAAGADVNAVDSLGQTAFHWAAILRCPADFFELLLEKKARSQANTYGKTPQYLYEITLKSSLVSITGHNSFKDLEYHLVEWDEHPELRKLNKYRALDYRNEKKDNQVSELLSSISKQDTLDKINDTTMNQQDDMGRTPMHWAVFYGKSETFEKLMQLGADIHIKDVSGYTPLGLAQMLQEKCTHKVSATFFSGIETTVQAGLNSTWKKFEEILSANAVCSLSSSTGKL